MQSDVIRTQRASPLTQRTRYNGLHDINFSHLQWRTCILQLRMTSLTFNRLEQENTLLQTLLVMSSLLKNVFTTSIELFFVKNHNCMCRNSTCASLVHDQFQSGRSASVASHQVVLWLRAEERHHHRSKHRTKQCNSIWTIQSQKQSLFNDLPPPGV